MAGFSIEAVNADLVAADYYEVAEAILFPGPVYRKVIDLLETAERRHFGAVRGRYVRTGATMESLTGSGGDAIRRIHGDTLDFGSAVPYAHFLTKAPKDPYDGQVRKRPPGKGLSAVLVFDRPTQKVIAEMVLDHITDPFGDVG